MDTRVSNEWISVDNELPDDDVAVIVWRKQGFQKPPAREYPNYPAYLLEGKWYALDDDGSCFPLQGVTHWQPLPTSRPPTPKPQAPKPQAIDRG